MAYIGEFTKQHSKNLVDWRKRKKMRTMFLIVSIALVLFAAAGVIPVLASQKPSVANVPGNTVVQDDEGDLILVNADSSQKAKPCSLPPGVPLYSPPWTDIKTAKITQLGNDRVELAMSLYAPVPEKPLFWVSYVWQFEGGCINPTPGVTYKDSVSVWWNPEVGKWQGSWFVITSCSPTRTIERGDPVEVRFSEDGVRARVQLDDLIQTTSGEEIRWHAAVRRLPFVWDFPDTIGVDYANTIGVDYAPDVVALNSLPPPPFLVNPQPPATWQPRH